MVSARRRAWALGAVWLLAAGIAGAGVQVGTDDPRCIAIHPAPFPPGLDFVPGDPGVVLAAGFSPGFVVPIDMRSVPPEASGRPPVRELRGDISRDACAERTDPAFDGLVVPDGSLAFLTSSACESVAFLDPADGALVDLDVGVPAGLPAGTYPFAPSPGSRALRAAVSTRRCVVAPEDALDSFGEPIDAGCASPDPSFFTSFTSGAARVGDRLFVTTSNLGAGVGTLETQYLPGTVLAFDLDLGGPGVELAPAAAGDVIFTSGFNPTHVTAHRTAGGRDLLLVTVSGAAGLVTDDPRTPERESGGVARSEAAIDVIDPEQLRLVASIPLGFAALSFERLAIDPTGRVALAGSAIARRVYAVDLAPLDALEPGDPYVVLDGDDGPDAVILDAEAPLELPALPKGAPPEACPGFVVGIDFADDGRRAYATDFCDGTLTVIGLQLRGSPPAPLSPTRLSVQDTIELVAPAGAAALGKPRAPGALRVRPGTPGVDFDGPEVAFLVGLPEGLLCGITVPAPEPSGGALCVAALTALAALAARRRSPLESPAEGGTP